MMSISQRAIISYSLLYLKLLPQVWLTINSELLSGNKFSLKSTHNRNLHYMEFCSFKAHLQSLFIIPNEVGISSI